MLVAFWSGMLLACGQRPLFALSIYERSDHDVESASCPPGELNLLPRHGIENIRRDVERLPYGDRDAEMFAAATSAAWSGVGKWIRFHRDDAAVLLAGWLATARSGALLTEDLEKPCTGALCWTLAIAQESCAKLLVKCETAVVAGARGALHCEPVVILDPDPIILVRRRDQERSPEASPARELAFRQPRISCSTLLHIVEEALRSPPLGLSVIALKSSTGVVAIANRRPSPILSTRYLTIWESVTIAAWCSELSEGVASIAFVSNLLINEQNTAEHYDWHEAPSSMGNRYADAIVASFIARASALCTPPRRPVIDHGEYYKCP